MSKEAETILRRMVDCSPLYASDLHNPDSVCFFCGDIFDYPVEYLKVPHDHNCDWVRARALLNMTLPPPKETG